MSTKESPSIGLIENNEFYFTKEYLEHIDEYALMDGGVIYVATLNDDLIIRNNYIHDIDGMKKNRGVFLDDGARNVTVVGNVIVGIANSYCIESDRSKSVEKVVGPANVNNTIKDNVLDGAILFFAREGGNNGCTVGPNYFLISKGNDKISNAYQQLNKNNVDIYLDYKSRTGGNIYISRNDIKKIGASSEWSYIKKIVKGR